MTFSEYKLSNIDEGGSKLDIPKRMAKPITDKILSWVGESVKSTLVYSMEFTYFRADIDLEIVRKYFPRIPWRIDAMEVTKDRKIVCTYDMPEVEGKYHDHVVYKGTVIVVVIDVNTVNGSRDCKYNLTMYSLNRKKDIQNVKRFYLRMKKETEYRRRNTVNEVIWIWNGRMRTDDMNRPFRSFDNVFIPKETEKTLASHIDGFIKNKSWYKEHAVPYHFGIILHGVPGGGKSSIIQALMNRYKHCEFNITPAHTVKDLFSDTSWMRYRTNDAPKFIVIEDIDTCGFSEEREDAKTNPDGKTAKEILGIVLNAMDGIAAIDNVIYIFTTNHIDMLDPALIRPGRIDLTLEIGYVTDETMSKFLNFHFGRALPENAHVKDHLTFASLQTLVMMGKSYDEIVKEVSK